MSNFSPLLSWFFHPSIRLPRRRFHLPVPYYDFYFSPPLRLRKVPAVFSSLIGVMWHSTSAYVFPFLFFRFVIFPHCFPISVHLPRAYLPFALVLSNLSLPLWPLDSSGVTSFGLPPSPLLLIPFYLNSFHSFSLSLPSDPPPEEFCAQSLSLALTLCYLLHILLFLLIPDLKVLLSFALRFLSFSPIPISRRTSHSPPIPPLFQYP